MCDCDRGSGNLIRFHIMYTTPMFRMLKDTQETCGLELVLPYCMSAMSRRGVEDQ
jgi:hypothetical protein